jgi:hypothetical protein
MRKVVATEYVSLDGFMEDPAGGDGTKHGGWSFQFWNEEAAKFKFKVNEKSQGSLHTALAFFCIQVQTCSNRSQKSPGGGRLALDSRQE